MHSTESDCRGLTSSNRLFCLPAGDVLQLPVPVRRVDLLPGSGSASEGLRGRDSTHVHTQGNARFMQTFL